MKRAAEVIISILIILSLLSGCQDSIDIEDRDICTAVVVDKEDGRLAFYVEVAQISSKIQNLRSEQSGGQQHSASIVKGSGTTYAEARANLDKELNKTVYLGAVQSLILTERLAESGIEEYTLRLRQTTEYRKTMDVIITPDNPEEFLGALPANESAVGFAIEDTLENMVKLGTTYHLSLADLLQKFESKNPCYLLNTLSIREGQISLTGNTVLNKGMRLGFIPEEDSRGIVFLAALLRNKPKTEYVINYQGKAITEETTLKKRSIKARYDGGKPVFDVDLSFQAVGQYPSERIKITADMRREFTSLIRERIAADIGKAIDTSQKEYGCDYLSFSEPFRINYPEAFEAMDWREEFQKAEFNVNIKVKVIANRNVDYNPEPVL
jgi:spore germination protein KC